MCYEELTDSPVWSLFICTSHFSFTLTTQRCRGAVCFKWSQYWWSVAVSRCNYFTPTHLVAVTAIQQDWVQARCLHDWAPRYLADPSEISQPMMLLLTVFVYDPLTWIVSLLLAANLACTAVGLFVTLSRQFVTHCQVNLEIRTALIVLNDSLKRYFSASSNQRLT